MPNEIKLFLASILIMLFVWFSYEMGWIGGDRWVCQSKNSYVRYTYQFNHKPFAGTEFYIERSRNEKSPFRKHMEASMKQMGLNPDEIFTEKKNIEFDCKRVSE